MDFAPLLLYKLFEISAQDRAYGRGDHIEIYLLRSEEAQLLHLSVGILWLPGIVAAEIDNLEVGHLIPVWIDVMGLRSRVHAEELYLLRYKAHFLQKLPSGAVLRRLIHLHRTTGIPPFVVV